MENASKALIIAGAILLSILLISLGIMVYQNAKSTIDDANLDDTEITAFNEGFLDYCGEKKSAADAKGVISKAISTNASAKQKGDSTEVKINVNGEKTAAAAAKEKFEKGKTYDIEPTIDEETGKIKLITITEHK